MIIVFIVIQLFALLIIGLMLMNSRRERKIIKKDLIIGNQAAKIVK